MIYHSNDLAVSDIGIDDDRLRFLATSLNVYEMEDFRGGELTDTQRLHIIDCLMDERRLHTDDAGTVPVIVLEVEFDHEVVQCVRSGELFKVRKESDDD